jgi:hypothetical protein
MEFIDGASVKKRTMGRCHFVRRFVVREQMVRHTKCRPPGNALAQSVRAAELSDDNSSDERTS